MKVERFQGEKSVKSVIEKGVRMNLGAVLLRAFRNTERKAHRVAVVCPKTVSRRAVDRSRLRRVFFDAARMILGDLEIPYDLVILIRPGFSLKGINRRDAERLISPLTKLHERS